MTPKIDYKLLGKAVEHYEERGFKYVEVPWAVTEECIRATLPEGFAAVQLATEMGGTRLHEVYGGENFLVGSAEQGFLSMNLKPGRYVGVTPCFRLEDHNDLFYQDMFMKVELFCNIPAFSVEEMVRSAESFFKEHSRGMPTRLVTDIGIDLMHAGVEIGSYGERTHEDFGRWVYGTGLALPRFSVANALSVVL
jgi:seryl-tRNA synthetase